MSGRIRKGGVGLGLSVIPPVLAAAIAHLGAIRGAITGDTFPGAPLDDGDTLYSLRLADDAWRHLADGIFAFPVAARTLNALDLPLVWSARAVGGALGLALLHVGLVLFAAAAGALYARALGAKEAGAAAGGLVAGASGLVLTTVGIGQYPQAMVAFPLLWFAGLARVWKREGGVGLAIVGGAGSLLLYWLYAPILVLGTLAFSLGAWTVGWPGPKWRELAEITIGCAMIVAPWAWPVYQSLATETKVAAVPWGTGFYASWAEGAPHVVGEVRLSTLFSPGWLGAGIVGLLGVRRERLPWVLLVLVGIVMVLGPLPMVPWGAPIAGLREALPAVPRWMDPAVFSAPRVENLPYLLVYQWLPGASRMRHPIRWGVLLLAGLVPLVGAGVDRLPLKIGWGVVCAVAIGAMVIGPWPLPQSPYPREAAALASCTEVLWPGLPSSGGALDRVDRLDAIHGRPRYPRPYDPNGGFGRLPAEEEQISSRRAAELAEGGELPEGACVVVDPRVNPGAGLSAEPEEIVLPAHTIGVEEERIRVWRVRR